MRKNLGQHFLNDNYILTKILNYADKKGKNDEVETDNENSNTENSNPLL